MSDVVGLTEKRSYVSERAKKCVGRFLHLKFKNGTQTTGYVEKALASNKELSHLSFVIVRLHKHQFREGQEVVFKVHQNGNYRCKTFRKVKNEFTPVVPGIFIAVCLEEVEIDSTTIEYRRGDYVMASNNDSSGGGCGQVVCANKNSNMYLIRFANKIANGKRLSMKMWHSNERLGYVPPMGANHFKWVHTENIYNTMNGEPIEKKHFDMYEKSFKELRKVEQEKKLKEDCFGIEVESISNTLKELM